MNKILKYLLPTITLALIFGSVSATVSNGQGILNEILKRMDAQNKSLTSLRAEVRMAKVNAQLGDDAEVTEGTAIYLPQKGKSALVRIDWRKPDESLAVVNKQYVIYRPRLQQAYMGSTDQAQGNAKAGGALTFMNMSRAQLKANYAVAYLGEATVSSGAKTWHLQLTPKTKTSYKSAEIWVDSDGFPVQSKVIENNNDSTTILLSKIEKNVTLKGSSFKIDIPKGTKIVNS
ncbi:MAG TPA: outer-membrane lipoprotein carrier protein LolA [Pyrinomonadaceae bacterium]|nr:outer-membrane lipoprotein carrier protein LolA [Pyrinomonadaceae bacterium]